MKLIDVTEKFKTQDDCLNYLEQIRWPDGKIGCVHCGEIGDNITRYTYPETTCKRKRKGVVRIEKVPARRVFNCSACGEQFTATSGTIFHDSHLPLTKWFIAVAIICEAKKGVSACQLQRHIGGSYRTSWYLCHRIREAMQEGGLLGGVVEADETFLTPKKPRKGRPYVQKDTTDVVLGMVERGGRLRLVPIKDVKMNAIEPELMKHIHPDSVLQTDESSVYAIIGQRHFPGRHQVIRHRSAYAIGEVHTQNIENAFSLLKRGIYGTFHKVSIKHLGRYCNEFSYRFNRRGSQLEMFRGTVKQLARGKNLPYAKLTAKTSEEVSGS